FRVFARLLQAFRDGVRTHQAHAQERDGLAAAIHHVAVDINDGHAAVLSEVLGSAWCAAIVEQMYLRADELTHLVFELIVEREAIDEPGKLRLGSNEGAARDALAQLERIEV